MKKYNIVNGLCRKYEKSEMLIKRMVDFALKGGFSLEETTLFIEKFFYVKSMQ